jgi:hypothetical protein
MRVKLGTLLLVGALLGALSLSASSAYASFGIEKFVAINCTVETCAQKTTTIGPFTYSEPEEPKEAEEKSEGFTKAGGRVPFGITDFKVKTEGSLPTEKPEGKPVTHIRTDVAAGLATNPTAPGKCTKAQFGTEEAAPGLFKPPTCPANSIIGNNKATIYAEGSDVPLEGTVYNLEPEEGHASEFGVALNAAPLGAAGLFAHTLIKGSVEWGKGSALSPQYIGTGTNAGDYHDYFEIEVSPALPLISSRLTFIGNENQGTKKPDNFITNATSCPGNLTTTLRLEGEGGVSAEPKSYAPKHVTLEDCNAVPFEPGFALTPATPVSDQGDGFTAEGTVNQEPTSATSNSEVKTITVQLPEGMTLNPSAASELGDCTPAQARIHSPEAGVSCPASSKIGTVDLEVPTLPAGSLTGTLYLGGPESGSITGPPYTMYVDAESARYGVSVRLKGEVFPNEATGQLTTVFDELPEQPFTSAILHFNGGALAPVANPLACSTAAATALFTPYSGTGTLARADALSFSGCTNPLALAPGQSTSVSNPNGGAGTAFTFNLERPEGDQYLSQLTTTLPKGLAGAVPAVEQCPEPQASQGACPAGSQIGTATVLAGSGTPYSFSGPVYFTGPYNNAPFGLSIAVPAVAGPFNLGTVITRASINVRQDTGQVVVTTTLPRIVKGVPIRIRKITVAVTKAGFMRNPTNCAALSTVSSVTGYVPGSSESATVAASSPFQAANCGSLAFKPAFTATSGAKVSKVNGASLETTIKMPSGDSNIKSVLVQLPKQLVSRLTTLNKACLAANFETNPYSCPAGSYVGGVTATTPLLPGTLTGPAVLVSHGGEAFPDLDLILNGSGVRVILVGHTKITKGITTTNFSETPDVPVNSITVKLPVGSHSAVTNYGELCPQPLVMPTTITGWNGTPFKQNTIIKVTGCGVRIVGQKIVGSTAYVTVQTYAAGRISGSGSNLKTVYRYLKGASKAVSLKVPLSNAGLRRGRPLKVRVRVGFLPTKRSLGTSSAYKTVTFR